MTRFLSLVIIRYSIEPRIMKSTKKYVKGYGFLSFARKYKKQVQDAGPDYLNTASKKVVHKTGEIIENEMADTVSKSNDDKIMK